MTEPVPEAVILYWQEERIKELESKLTNLAERIEILRRIAERSIKDAQRQIDQWQHVLDEIERIRLEVVG